MEAQLISISSTSLLLAFALYFIGGIIFVVSILGKNFSGRDPVTHQQKWSKMGMFFAILGFLAHLAYFITRWMGQGHAPLTSMFEYMTFLTMMIVLAFIIVYSIYKLGSLGAFVLPVAVTLLGWASVFDRTPSPLVPSLQSNWLKLHVSTTALGQGLFAVSFVAGLMYIIRVVDQKKSSKSTFFLECFLACVLMLVGFIIVTSSFSAMGYSVNFEYTNEKGKIQQIEYTLPPIAGPYQGIKLTEESMEPIISTPAWMKGKDAPRKFNTMIWSVISGILLYALLRLVLRKRLGVVLQPWLKEMRPTLLDEVTYRAIAIGFPIFTLGGLIFAMIWAEQAWGRFWGWDPKEVWALITWLFYSAYLHFRLSKGWHGEKSAWLAVGGFIIIMFNLVFVNLIIAGMHSYAG